MPPTPRFAALQPCSRSARAAHGVLVERDRRARAYAAAVAASDCGMRLRRARACDAVPRREAGTGLSAAGAAAPQPAAGRHGGWTRAATRVAERRRPRQRGRRRSRASRHAVEHATVFTDFQATFRGRKVSAALRRSHCPRSREARGREPPTWEGSRLQVSDRPLLPPGHGQDLVGRGQAARLARRRARRDRRLGRARSRPRGGRPGRSQETRRRADARSGSPSSRRRSTTTRPPSSTPSPSSSARRAAGSTTA